jgi:hypothetical protein
MTDTPDAPRQNWKWLSFAALAGLVACIVALYLSNYAIFGGGPITFTIQVLAAFLIVWTRLTFRIRSFHGNANPNRQRAGDDRTVQVYPPPEFVLVLCRFLFGCPGATMISASDGHRQ